MLDKIEGFGAELNGDPLGDLKFSEEAELKGTDEARDAERARAAGTEPGSPRIDAIGIARGWPDSTRGWGCPGFRPDRGSRRSCRFRERRERFPVRWA